MDMTNGILHHVTGTGKAGYTGDGGPAASATFNGPKGIAVAWNRYVYVVDSGNNVIRRIDLKSALVTTVAGDKTKLNQPHGVCVAADGTLYIGDTLNHQVLRVRQK
jgi:DNA-binding beta-propeller fold protein YncE